MDDIEAVVFASNYVEEKQPRIVDRRGCARSQTAKKVQKLMQASCNTTKEKIVDKDDRVSQSSKIY